MKILLLLDHHGNRRLLMEALLPRYDVIEAASDDVLNDPYDLAIVDGVALDRLWERIQERKQSAQPAFLPFLFVSARHDVGMATRHLWKSIDELILSPIEKIELLARIEGLLTRRRLSLEFHHAMIQTSPVAILLLNHEGRVQQWNPAAEQLLGWSESEALEQPPPGALDTDQDVLRELVDCALRGELFTNVEVRRRKKDGSFIDIMVSAAPVRDAYGAVSHVVTLLSDITARKQAEESATRRLAELEAINRISTALRVAQTLDEMLPCFLDETLTICNAEAGAIWLYDNERNCLLESFSRGWFAEIADDSPNEGIAGYVFSSNDIYISPDFSIDDHTHESVRARIPAGQGGACIPIRALDAIIGVLFVAVKRPREIQPAEVRLLTSLAEIAGNAIQRMRLHEEVVRYAADLESAYDSTIEGWSRALDLRDKETEGHTLRVTEMTLRLARAAGMTEDQLIHVRRGVLLHDIGKMGVPDAILLKPDKLTEDEWKVMRQHPQLAYEMLASIDYLRPALDVPYCHHEKWDGSGYPRGLKGEQIPLAARLFAVVDVWDALRSDRPYRKAWSDDKVYEYIKSLAGTHFDPKAVELFFNVMREDTQSAD